MQAITTARAREFTGNGSAKGRKRLHLAGTVQGDEFLSLCDNLNPETGQRLTQRLKTTRRQIDANGERQEVANRRVFYDFTISPPKSVSIMALVGQDGRITKSHNRAVSAAVCELERFAGTRVHTAGRISDRNTARGKCSATGQCEGVFRGAPLCG